jgi:cation:H+ antiporter
LCRCPARPGRAGFRLACAVVSVALALPVFAVSAAVMFAAAGYFADKLDHIGPRIGLPESAVGLLTAVAADTPEIASAVVALLEGDREASLGVVVGSNVFNLAAMIGLSALLAGSVAVARKPLMVEGTVSVLALLVTAGLVAGAFSAPVALLLLLAVVAPYLVVTLRRGGEAPPAHHVERGALLRPVALTVPAVVLIVAGATGMVKAALALARHWHVSQTVTGVLILAVITSLPNAFTAVRLGLGGRGEALVTETLASNTINLTGGLLIPALFVAVAGSGGGIRFGFGWLAGMTLLTLVLLARPRGLGRAGGVLLVGLYAVFVAVVIAAG